MAYAINFYTGNGAQTTYSLTFPYISQSDVEVKVNNVTKTLGTDYTFPTSSTITFTTAPANGLVIKFTRTSNRATRLVDYQDGSTITEAILDQDSNQMFYMAQEAIDITENTIALDNDDKYDADNKVIKNLASPVADTDAVNKAFISTNLPNINTVAGISGAVTTVAGISSAVTGVNSNNADITTVAGQITPTNNISTLAGINADITTVANNETDIQALADLEDGTTATGALSTLAGLDTELEAVYNIRTNITNVDGNSANVNLLAGQISPTNNISTLANLDTELSAIYNIRTNITNVDTNSPNVNLVAGQISPTNNIATLGALGTQLTNLGALGTEITNLNNIRTDITGVNNINSQVQTVAGLNTEITNLDSISADITAVANISGDIQDVQDKIAELQTVANDLNEVTSEIETVAGSINQVDAIGNDLLGANTIGTVATNIGTVNEFGQRYRVSGTAPSTSLDLGDLYFDTASNTMKVYSSGGWINAGSSVNGTADRYKYTATASQTTFTGADDNGNTLAYDAGFLDVYLNGIRLVNNSDFTASSGSSIVLTTGASASDILEVVAFGTFQLANFSITDANDVPVLGSAGQALVVNSGGTALEFANASSAEVYGFRKDSNGDLLVTTTNQGQDSITQSEYANFDDVLFSASGFTFSLSNGELIATI
jgi:uncharacterized protein YoxC